MINFFQAVGIVFMLIVLVFITVAAMYLSYIIGIGLLLVMLVFIVKHVLKSIHASH